MNDKIFLISPPDDLPDDGLRILLVGLTTDQNELISSTLSQIEYKNKTLFYIWNVGDSISWLMDKKLKSHLIIFNAQSSHQGIVGYMAAQPNSCYLGDLRDLNIINNSVLLDKESVVDILETYIGKYERLFK